MEHMLAKMDPIQAKVDTNLKEMKEQIVVSLEAMIQNNQDRMEAWMNANNEMSEVIHSVHISWMDIH
jgi:uncharacterized iron-regulated protein